MKHEHEEVFKVNVAWVLHWEHLFSTLYLCQVLVPVVFVCFEVWVHLYRSISTRKNLLWNNEYTSGTSCTSLLKSRSYIQNWGEPYPYSDFFKWYGINKNKTISSKNSHQLMSKTGKPKSISLWFKNELWQVKSLILQVSPEMKESPKENAILELRESYLKGLSGENVTFFIVSNLKEVNNHLWNYSKWV